MVATTIGGNICAAVIWTGISVRVTGLLYHADLRQLNTEVNLATIALAPLSIFR